jgi:hypothetical protein
MRARQQLRPGHRRHASAHAGLGRQIDQDGAEQRQRNPDATEDEVLPRRLDSLVRAVEAHHQHRRQCGAFDRHPHQAEIVGGERQQHGENESLIHAMIEAQVGRLHPADLDLMIDIAGAEQAGGEGDERSQRHQIDIEIVDDDERRRLGPLHEQNQADGEGEPGGERVSSARRAHGPGPTPATPPRSPE